jgi:hypothetical protein
MIRYDLICDKGHAFDGWFSDSDAFETQAKRGFVECAICGSHKVEKQLMAPRLGAKANSRTSEAQPVVAAPMTAPLADPRLQQMLQMVRDIRRHVEENAENVGDRFADEARKIHYGESEERGIFGNATQDETKALIEEGIEVHPLPRLPEERN